MRHWISKCLIMVAISSALSIVAHADNVEELLKSVSDNYKAKNYQKALEDLDWIKKEISGLQMEIIKTLLPQSIPGYETQEIDGGAAFGIQNVSRQYIKDEKRIQISISGGQTSGTTAGLGALMGMAAAMGAMDAGVQSNMVIVQGRKGQFNLESEDQHGTLIFNLNNNAFVSIETWGFGTSDEAKAAAEKLDMDKIEKAYH